MLQVRKQANVEERKQHELSDGSMSSGAAGEDPEEDPEEGDVAQLEDRELEAAFKESIRLAEENQRKQELAAQEL